MRRKATTHWTYDARSDQSLIDNVIFLLNTRYQLKPENGLAFFDYQDHDAFITDLDAAEEDRDKFKRKIEYLAQSIKTLINHQSHSITFSTNNREEVASLEHLVGRLIDDSSSSQDNLDNIFLRPSVIRETPKIQRQIDRMIARDKMSKNEAAIHVLIADAQKPSPLDYTSNIVREMYKHGYIGSALVEAVRAYAEDDYTFIRINSRLHDTIETIEFLLHSITSLDINSGEALLATLRAASGKLFRIYI